MTIGDWAHLDNIPGPESDPANIDKERQTMSKYQVWSIFGRVAQCTRNNGPFPS